MALNERIETHPATKAAGVAECEVKHPATDGENCEKVAGFAKTEGNAKALAIFAGRVPLVFHHVVTAFAAARSAWPHGKVAPLVKRLLRRKRLGGDIFPFPRLLGRWRLRLR